ncbi:MAG: dihydroorotate dehydrogenase (quinone), partial [Pseudomonadota bacterium]|nr:dihydroorotate dehydrogenase (quinone) [Pseudomonadota bacterium]
HQFTKGNLPIVACGGVWSGQDAFDCLAAGASLIQIGTVLRYEGPKAVTKINQELADILKEKGIKSVSEVVGIDFK